MIQNFGEDDMIHLGEFGYPGYFIERDGAIYRAKNKHWVPLKYYKNTNGLTVVNLIREDGKRTSVPVANLVGKAFLPGMTKHDNTIINLNGDRSDNRVENLAWRPRWFANEYHKMFRDHSVDDEENPVIELETEFVFPNVMSACVHYGILFGDVLVSIETTLPSYGGPPRTTYPTGTSWAFH